MKDVCHLKLYSGTQSNSVHSGKSVESRKGMLEVKQFKENFDIKSS